MDAALWGLRGMDCGIKTDESTVVDIVSRFFVKKLFFHTTTSSVRISKTQLLFNFIHPYPYTKGYTILDGNVRIVHTFI